MFAFFWNKGGVSWIDVELHLKLTVALCLAYICFWRAFLQISKLVGAVEYGCVPLYQLLMQIVSWSIVQSQQWIPVPWLELVPVLHADIPYEHILNCIFIIWCCKFVCQPLFLGWICRQGVISATMPTHLPTRNVWATISNQWSEFWTNSVMVNSAVKSLELRSVWVSECRQVAHYIGSSCTQFGLGTFES